VAPEHFEKSLVEAGWSKMVSKDGQAVILSKDGARYVIRSGGRTADYYKPGSHKADLKIRLEGYE
jgi:hypothetical protein